VRLLLDTHLFLWLARGSPRLSTQTKETIENADTVYVSSASIWEIAIKVALKKLDADPDQLIEEIEANGFEELPVLAKHAKGVAKLPHFHGDPFDRILVAQAISETMRLLTVDKHLAPYSELVTVI
jgi:PIN domain nuclease of toxin-antitoxin system